MHVQRTWEGILNAPVSLEDVVFAEWVWAASKSFLSGVAVLLVATALGLAQSWTMIFIVPLAFLIGLCFAGLGLVMTALAKSYDFFMYWFTLALTPMMLLSGVFYPLANMRNNHCGVFRKLHVAFLYPRNSRMRSAIKSLESSSAK